MSSKKISYLVGDLIREKFSLIKKVTTYEVAKEVQETVVVPADTTALLESLLFEKLGYPGRLISGSKSGYRNAHLENLTIFNANICIDEGKVWYGDIDVTKSKVGLQEIVDKTNKTLYILFEMDGRFEYEERPILKNSAAIFRPGKKPELRKDLLQYNTQAWNS
jgi:hypothetical protein